MCLLFCGLRSNLSQMPPRIPSELIEHMMDELSTDRTTLGLCGLVRSRHLLFSSVVLVDSQSTLFIDILQSPTCQFASYVSNLCIDPHRDQETSSSTSSRQFYTLVTSSAFGRLACAHSLRLSNIDWTAFSVSEQFIIESGLARLTGLRKIELHSLSFHDLKGVLRLANAFPLLNHIRLTRMRFSKYLEYNVSSAKNQRFPPTWEIIEIDAGDAVPAFLHCICANLSVAPLGVRLLKLLHIEQNHRLRVQEALRSIASEWWQLDTSLPSDNCEFCLTISLFPSATKRSSECAFPSTQYIVLQNKQGTQTWDRC
ncbi:hypothetical protein B0H17DRAFT_1073852 [Mycena rosella]|uniref:Uncharacterized protein n=1 Tax=Mycena rosella TaxID=1033263 RepID=A0AAD7D8D7_MYCRO|nr:hypothetical protein B0H17DRAFT_1073852 [Mycena rosella]